MSMHESRQVPGRKGLPGWVLALLYVAVSVLALILAYSSGLHRPQNPYVGLARATGIVAASMLLLQFVTSGRFETISGRIGLDKTMGFHRLAAMAAFAMVLLHVAMSVLRIPHWDVQTLWSRLVLLLTASDMLTATAALVVLAYLVLNARYFRARLAPYPVWRLVHGLLATGMVVLAALHVIEHAHALADPFAFWTMVALCALAALAMLAIYVLRPLSAYAHGFTVQSARRIGPDIAELVLRAPSSGRFAFEAGQFAWLAIGGRHTVTDNPFSIASAPADLPDLRFLVREVGDMTRRVATLAPGTRIAVDGPHGSFVLPPDHKGPVLMIAGGIGIAPVLSHIRQMALSGDTRPVRLIAAARNAASHVARDQIEELGEKLDFKALHLVDEDDGAPGCEMGRCEPAHIARASAGLDLSRTVALVCGPPAMMHAAVEHLLDAGIGRDRIVMEAFDYDAAGDRVTRSVGRRFLATLAAVFALALGLGSAMVR